MPTGSQNIVSVLILLLHLVLFGVMVVIDFHLGWAAGIFIIGLVLATSPRLINEWDRAVLLRLGKYRKTLSPGMYWVIPGIDQLIAPVDMRVRSTTFCAEKTLTKDTVPVDVDAVMFWVVTDAKKAVLEVKEYGDTVSWAAQTTLRDVIGQTELAGMVSDRARLDAQLLESIDAKSAEWGITVQSVEIRDVTIPRGLEDAMSRKAQAEREKEARIILAECELRVAQEMTKATETYQNNEQAMQLRAMNMTYEAIKEKGSLMVVPSGISDALNLGVLGAAAAKAGG